MNTKMNGTNILPSNASVDSSSPVSMSRKTSSTGAAMRSGGTASESGTRLTICRRMKFRTLLDSAAGAEPSTYRSTSPVST